MELSSGRLNKLWVLICRQCKSSACFLFADCPFAMFWVMFSVEPQPITKHTDRSEDGPLANN